MTEASTERGEHTPGIVERRLRFALLDWKLGDRRHFPSINALTIAEAADLISELLEALEETERLNRKGINHCTQAELDNAEAMRRTAITKARGGAA